MTARQILLSLADDTTATECVSCPWRSSHAAKDTPSSPVRWTDKCTAFGVELSSLTRRNRVQRAPECIESERAAKALTKLQSKKARP